MVVLVHDPDQSLMLVSSIAVLERFLLQVQYNQLVTLLLLLMLILLSSMLLYVLRSSCKPGLANFNPLERHTVHKDSSDDDTCAYTNRKGRGAELTRMLLFTNMTFVLLLFINVAILCSVNLLYYVC
jgi:hypothetical protein